MLQTHCKSIVSWLNQPIITRSNINQFSTPLVSNGPAAVLRPHYLGHNAIHIQVIYIHYKTSLLGMRILTPDIYQQLKKNPENNANSHEAIVQ